MESCLWKSNGRETDDDFNYSNACMPPENHRKDNDRLCTVENDPVTDDYILDSVPDAVKKKKKVILPELTSMWKYMLSSSHANKRLQLYSFLNSCLRNGTLSRIVGHRVLNRVINRDACELTGVSFWQIDRESFYADVHVTLNLQTEKERLEWKGLIVCICEFADDFVMSVEELTENADRNGMIMLSPFLVPYMTNAQVDTESDSIWIRYGIPEALADPSRRYGKLLAERMGLTVRYLKIYDHKGKNSILFFKDGEILIDSGRYSDPKTERIEAGTIVVNTNILNGDYSEFNILHECIHYEKHYLFYRLQEMCCSDSGTMKTTEVEVEEGKDLKDPVFFMERQADRGAYALMMPADYMRNLIKTECERYSRFENFGEKFENVGTAIKHKLALPYFRIKARMIQLGYIEAKGALNRVEGRFIRPFAFNRDSWRANEITYIIDRGSVDELYDTNRDFRALLDSRTYVYADGHIVRYDPRYVKLCGDSLALTDDAALRADDCCLRFGRQYIQRNVGEYIPGRMYYDAHYVQRSQFYLYDVMNKKQIDAIDAKIEYKDNFPRTFVKAFDMIMKKNNRTRESTAPELHISERTLSDWLNNPEKYISADFVIYISLMWEIPDWISGMLLDRAMIRLSEFDKRHQALEHIRTVLWDQGLDAANEFLTEHNLEPLHL